MAALIDKADYCAITVSEDNTYFLNKEPVSIDEMGGRLRTMIIGNPDLRVYLNGDKNAHHGSVVAVLDRLRAAGFEKISIETNAEEAANE
jgi:biopolymer transport protein ExbD